MISLIELIQSTHYKERKQQRGEIKNIEFRTKFESQYPYDEIKSKLKQRIEEDLRDKLKEIEKLPEKGSKGRNYKVVSLYRPVLNTGDTKVLLNLTVGSQKGDKVVETQGDLYVVIFNEQAIITVYLSKSGVDLEKQSEEHLERRGITNYRLQVIDRKENYTKVIDLKELMEGKEVKLSKAEVEEQDLPYKVRTDYRKGAVLDHEKYGKQKIVNTSNGVRGQPNQSGKLDWVEIESPPYVKSGKLMKTRKIPNIYAKTYWIDKE